jgi:hypothetical protein
MYKSTLSHYPFTPSPNPISAQSPALCCLVEGNKIETVHANSPAVRVTNRRKPKAVAKTRVMIEVYLRDVIVVIVRQIGNVISASCK